MPGSLDTLQTLSSLTVLNAKAALEQGLDAIKGGQTCFDLRNVTAVDSAAVSVMLAWQRAAHEKGVKLDLQNLPTNLKNLTKLYGVCSLVSSSLDATDCGAIEQTFSYAEAAADLAAPAPIDAPVLPTAGPANAGPSNLHHH